jgi:hypothetical protein
MSVPSLGEIIMFFFMVKASLFVLLLVIGSAISNDDPLTIVRDYWNYCDELSRNDGAIV